MKIQVSIREHKCVNTSRLVLKLALANHQTLLLMETYQMLNVVESVKFELESAILVNFL